jgi:hypothetical protein
MSLIVGKKPTAPPSTSSEPIGFELSNLEIAWAISVALLGAAVLVWGLVVGRLTEPISLAKYLLAWSMLVGLVPLPLQVMRRKIPPGFRFVCGAAVHLYIIATLFVLLAAGEAVTWEKLAQPFQWGAEATRITIEGIGYYKK